MNKIIKLIIDIGIVIFGIAIISLHIHFFTIKRMNSFITTAGFVLSGLVILTSLSVAYTRMLDEKDSERTWLKDISKRYFKGVYFYLLAISSGFIALKLPSFENVPQLIGWFRYPLILFGSICLVTALVSANLSLNWMLDYFWINNDFGKSSIGWRDLFKWRLEAHKSQNENLTK